MEEKYEEVKNKESLSNEEFVVKKRKYRKREKYSLIGNQNSKKETM